MPGTGSSINPTIHTYRCNKPDNRLPALFPAQESVHAKIKIYWKRSDNIASSTFVRVILKAQPLLFTNKVP